MTRRGADLAAYSHGEWDASRKDERIRAVTAIDPAPTYGLGRNHARDLVERVLLIGLGGAETRLPATDFSATGSGLASHLPAADIETMAPAVHSSALLPCKPRDPAILAAERDDPVCDDLPGTDCPALHERIEAIQEKMRTEAIAKGEEILKAEFHLANLFPSGQPVAADVKRVAKHPGIMRGQLQAIHLLAHIERIRELTSEQIAGYDGLRGYRHRRRLHGEQHPTREASNAAPPLDAAGRSCWSLDVLGRDRSGNQERV